jgi:hypothetical protein
MQNKTFMITGRYASSQTMIEDADREEEKEYEQPQFGDIDDIDDDEGQIDIDKQTEQDNGGDKFYNWNWDDNVQHNDQPEYNDHHNEAEEDTDLQDDDPDVEQPEEAVEMEMPDGVEQLTPEDIRIFLENESVVEAQRASQEVNGHHAPHINKIFDTEKEAYQFYNEYTAICGFSVKKAGNYKGKHVGDEIGTRRTYTCSKFGKVVDPDVLEERKKKKQERKE